MRFDMFFDYYRGISQKELEQKYNEDIRTITRKCKNAMAYLFNTNDSIINQNIEKIKKEIERL